MSEAEDDPGVVIDGDVITIYGIRYSLGLFKTLRFAPLGARLRIMRRVDGVVTLLRLPAEPGDEA